VNHSPNFLRLVNEARPRVKEITLEQARARLAQAPPPILLDVREDHEWHNGHAAQAVHLGRGILERDLESLFQDYGTEIIMYCGGGYRSVLAADVAQRIGYRRVYSLIGGYRAMLAAGWPVVR
jgi:rhodanese-related sulfurtransferase